MKTLMKTLKALQLLQNDITVIEKSLWRASCAVWPI